MIKKIINGVLLGFLLLIVLGIINKCSGKSSIVLDTPLTNINVKTKTDFKVAKDSFKLVLINNNPFKTSKQYLKTINTIKKTKPKASNLAPVKNFKWPTIEYYGFVKGSQSKDKLALIKVGNRLYRKRENQTIDDLKIKKAYSDSIIFVNANDSQTILRK